MHRAASRLAPRRAGLALALLAGCGPSPPPLPPAEPPPQIAERGDPARGHTLFADRGFARTGLACADCHPAPAEAGAPAAIRPAPPLHRWAAGRATWAGRARPPALALAACVERYQARPPPTAAEAGDLRAALATPPPEADAPPDAAALYDRACRHCHEAGPAGPILGRHWSPSALRRRLRRPDPPPEWVMPPFGPEALPDAALAALVEFIAARAVER